MSHEITILSSGEAHHLSNGQAEAAFVGSTWHGLGVDVSEAMNSEEAMHLAHLTWLVNQYPVYKKMPDGEMVEVPGWKTNTRSDNNFDLGLVKNNYQVVQNHVAFQVMDSLYMDGILKYESAFSLNGGKDVVLLARLPKVDEVVDGDVSHRYLMMVLNHAGLKCIIFLPTSVRVVCANTKRLALNQGEGQILKVRHTGDMNLKLEDARQALLEINEAFSKETIQAREMASKLVSKDESVEYLDHLYPMPKLTDENFTQRRFDKVKTIREDVMHNYLYAPEQQISGIKESRWSLFNAVTQYEDHRNFKGKDIPSKAETRFKAITLGQTHELKRKAWNYWNDAVSVN